MVNLKSLILISFFIFSTAGCSMLHHAEQLLTLKAVGDSGDEIEAYLLEQERLFQHLLDDIKQERLKAGVTKREIVKLYGDPVISEWNPSSRREIFLYRLPTDYFSSDKVYLYFNPSGKLDYWEYQPYQE